MKITSHVHHGWTECKHRDGQCCDACHVDYEALRYEARMARNAKQRERRATAEVSA